MIQFFEITLTHFGNEVRSVKVSYKRLWQLLIAKEINKKTLA